MKKLRELAKTPIGPVVLGVLALGLPARADVQLSYSINGGPPTACTTAPDSAGNTGVNCPSVTSGGVTVTNFSGFTNWPGTPTSVVEFASTLQITNSGSAPATVVLWVSGQNFASPTVPPGTITWSNQQSMDGTAGTTTANSVGCLDQSNSLAPPGTANYCASGIPQPNTPLTITGSAAANSNVKLAITSLSAPYSLSTQITLTLSPGAIMHIQNSQILNTNLTLACASSSGQVNVPYSSSLSATGGTPPYFYSIISGSLPPGLSLNPSTGAITGTPVTPGTFSFTAQVMDSSGNSSTNTATANCTITITPSTAPLTLSCASGTGVVGSPYSSSLTATGGVPPYTFFITSGALPPGLTLNASTGAITGTPTTAGTFNFTAQVVDSSGNPASNTVTTNCSIVIAPSPTATCVWVDRIRSRRRDCRPG